MVNGFVMTDAEIAEALAEREAYAAWMDMRDSYADYVEALAEDLAADTDDEEGDEDYIAANIRRFEAPYDDDTEPVPPAPALAFITCATCDDAGAVTVANRILPHLTFRKPCPDCRAKDSIPTAAFVGRTREATPPTAPVPFDRAAHCRRIASYGGVATFTTHGAHYMRIIGQTGARVTVGRYGYAFWRGLMDAKGWQAPRQVSFLDDLRAGHALAELERAA